VGYIFNSFSTFWALSISGFLNAWIMRRTEMQKGIDVLEPETMEPVGVSKNCAQKAVYQTAVTRILFNVLIFYPPMVILAIERMHLRPKHRHSWNLI
jgi:hypothetical protein